MEHLEAFIWHDQLGNIVAVGHLPAGCKYKVEPAAKAGQKVIRRNVPAEQIRNLHLTHMVDPETSTLYSRADAASET